MKRHERLNMFTNVYLGDLHLLYKTKNGLIYIYYIHTLFHLLWLKFGSLDPRIDLTLGVCDLTRLVPRL